MIERMDNVGIVVDDLAAAIAFFVDLGLELEGEATVEGPLVDRLVGLEASYFFFLGPRGLWTGSHRTAIDSLVPSAKRTTCRATG